MPDAPAVHADCLFCRIVQKEIPSSTVREDETTLAFRDIAPKAPTHVLVVPKTHVAKIDEAAEEHAELLGKLLLAAGEVARQEKLEDYRLVVNNGEGAGQSVFHLHVHLLGGRPFSWPPG